MAAKRLYQVSDQFNLSSQALVKLVRGLGFQVKSHMSVASDEIMAAVHKELERQKNALKKEIEEKQRRLRQRRERQQRSRRVPAKSAQQKSSTPPQSARKSTVTLKEVTANAAPPATKTDTARSKDKSKEKGKDSRPGPRRPHDRKRRRREKKRSRSVDQREIAASFKRTIAKIGSRSKAKKYRKGSGGVGTESGSESGRVIEVSEFMSVAELAGKLEVTPSEVVAKCLELGMLATINQRLDIETIGTIALEFDFDIKEVAEIGADLIPEPDDDNLEKTPRAPVVTIMGHVDHGKTSLLDHIRQSNIIAGESGGITQHIGAYSLELSGGRICFLDTPGHEAFTAMRARGALITDIVVLVVAQDDKVMPQTIEAIDHAKAAKVPIIVAINKMDLPGADVQPVMDGLSKRGLLAEEWGGDTLMFPISAKTGDGIDKLLEGILVQAEMLELKAPRDRSAKGVIVDARLDKGRGPQATVLIQEGRLDPGHYFVAGESFGRVRMMLDERGRTVKQAGPAVPVVVTGFSRVPQAGDTFVGTDNEQIAKDISRQRERVRREQLHRGLRKVHLDNLHEHIKEGEIKELFLVIKGDVDGSVEVLADTLEKIRSDEVAVNIILRGVGAINESDVLLAAASNAVVIGFHVRPDSRARDVANRENVDIRLYNVIYEADADIRAALEGMLAPETAEEETGRAEVRELFRISRLGVIAGCHVTEGTIHHVDRVHLVRDGVGVHTGAIANLRRFKDDVREVSSGYECGIRLETFNDIKVGDVIEAFRVKELERKLV